MTERSVTHDTIVLERTYPAPPRRVFAAWADPAARERWFVSGEEWEVAEYTHDFRVGGRERGRFRQTGGSPVFVNETVYQDIVPGERIVFAYTMARDRTLTTVSLATVELQTAGTGTRLRLTEQIAVLDAGDTVDARAEGWRELLDNLEAELRLVAA